MTLELAQFLMTATEEAGNEATIHPEYSGRGMMGKTTVGVEVESVTLLLADVLDYVREQIVEDYDERGNLIDRWDGPEIPVFDSFRIDNLGRNTIIY